MMLFTLFTDHNPLTELKGLKNVSGRIGRWMLFLQQFDFEIKNQDRCMVTQMHCLGHQQVMRQVERFNRTLEAMLAKVINENQKNWDTYRTSIHDTTGFTPFHLVFGCTPNLPVDLMLGWVDHDELKEYSDFVQDLHGKLKKSFSVANKRLSNNNERQKKANDKRCHGVDFKVGDHVWLYVTAVKPGKTEETVFTFGEALIQS